MRWDRAVHHVDTLAQACAQQSGFAFADLAVTQLWAVGDILGPPTELESVTVALCVDQPVTDVAWWTEPRGSQHWANATRLSKNPVLAWWRSAHAPVWNHRIVRPALVWDNTEGVRAEVLDALRAGRGETVASPAPSADELATRLSDELAVSRAALVEATAEYERRRWAPGKLEPVADRLWRASDGYLDVLDAVSPR
jgi:hypothetical protein